VPASRISPSYTSNTAKGAMLGILLAAAYIVLRYLLDEKIHSEDYLTHTYPDIPLLAVVPDMGDKKGKGSGDGYYGSNPSQERRRSRAESVERTELKRESARKQASEDQGQAPRTSFLKKNQEGKEGVSNG
jgi:hypothetical protein